ncbi:hypothetical protein BH10PSE7_BH10PSE7_15660 [soil metagenome]
MSKDEMLSELFAAVQLKHSLDFVQVHGLDKRQRTVATSREKDYLRKADLFFGKQMDVDLREVVSRYIFLYGIFESELTAFYVRSLKPGDTFFDVGAHYGYFSLLALNGVGEKGRVIAFEPSGYAGEMLKKNLGRSENATIVQAAVWHEPGTLVLNDFGPSRSAFNSFAGIRDDPNIKGEPFKAKAITLDQYVKETGIIPDFVKIDVESAEMHVLNGMKEVIRNHAPVISMELGDFAHLIQAGIERSFDLLIGLQNAGLRLFWPTMSGLTECKPEKDKAYPYSNVIAVPELRADDYAPFVHPESVQETIGTIGAFERDDFRVLRGVVRYLKRATTRYFTTNEMTIEEFVDMVDALDNAEVAEILARYDYSGRKQKPVEKQKPKLVQ